MQKKKETKAQLERRLNNALVFVPRDRDTISIYFSDKGVGLSVTGDSCVISTSFHRHVFNSITSSGYSRPYIYTQRVISIALENDCVVGDGYSFAKLLEVLKAKSDATEYNLVIYYSWWLHLIFDDLYSISEDEFSSWICYFKYVCMLGMNTVLLEERTEDMTNKSFVNKFLKYVKDMTKDVDEHVVLRKLTDEELVQSEMEALQAIENEQAMEDSTGV